MCNTPVPASFSSCFAAKTWPCFFWQCPLFVHDWQIHLIVSGKSISNLTKNSPITEPFSLQAASIRRLLWREHVNPSALRHVWMIAHALQCCRLLAQDETQAGTRRGSWARMHWRKACTLAYANGCILCRSLASRCLEWNVKIHSFED